jgi:hypothetical protein
MRRIKVCVSKALAKNLTNDGTGGAHEVLEKTISAIERFNPRVKSNPYDCAEVATAILKAMTCRHHCPISDDSNSTKKHEKIQIYLVRL